MAKTRLTEEKRSAIFRYMMDHYDKMQAPLPSAKLFDKVIEKTNAAIRVRFPESEMAVVRKYQLATKDQCIRFSQGSTGRVFAVEIDYGADDQLAKLADMPRGRGCKGNDMFPANDSFTTLVDAWMKTKATEKENRENTQAEYRAFVSSCKTVEDAEAVVTFTPEMREKLGATSSALVAVNGDTLARIKAEFSAVAA